jgi:hypothetical protein
MPLSRERRTRCSLYFDPPPLVGCSGLSGIASRSLTDRPNRNEIAVLDLTNVRRLQRDERLSTARSGDELHFNGVRRVDFDYGAQVPSAKTSRRDVVG